MTLQQYNVSFRIDAVVLEISTYLLIVFEVFSTMQNFVNLALKVTFMQFMF